MIDILKERLNSADVTNLSLFILSESDQLKANIIALAPKPVQEALLNRLQEDKRATLLKRVKAITSVNDYTLQIIQFALDDFDSRFKSKNHPLK